MEKDSSKDLRCSLCGKLAQSAQSRKRHEYYCKSKAKSSIKTRSRRRSCSACTKAKARCEVKLFNSPRCERCCSKNLTCTFDGSSSPRLETDLSTPSLPMLENLPYDAPLQLLTGSTFPFDFELPSTHTTQNDPTQGLPLSPSWNFLSTDSLFPQQASPELVLFSPKLLNKVEAIVSSTIAIGMLRSIPDMMLRRETFPPFIHPRCYGSEEDSWRLPASLANATMIAQMFSQRSAESRSLIWRTIRLEQERMSDWCARMNNADLLSSMQALIIYMLMRIMDGPTDTSNVGDDEDFGPQLIITMNRICARVCNISGTDPITAEEQGSHHLSWKDWVFAESKRRTVHILYLILDLFNVEIELACPRIACFAVAPLPSSKLLWRARDAEEWEEEWEKEVRETSVHGMLRNGDLVKLKSGFQEGAFKRAEWGRWYAGADELGILAVLGANLK